MFRTLLVGAVPLAFLVVVTTAGVDFGRYWDDDAMATKVRRALGPPLTLLPFAYDYPGVSFWLALSAIAPEAARDVRIRHVDGDSPALVAFTYTDRYRLRSRRVFAAVASLGVLATAGLSLALGASSWEAFFAAALFAVSWEVTYHFRWIAPDGVMAGLTAAAVLGATLALRSRDPRLLIVAAIAAGLATGCKYSAWPGVIPVAIAAAFSAGESIRDRLAAVIRIAFVAVATFLIVSPGTLLQPILAAGHIRHQIGHYASGHGIYTVASGLAHLRRMLLYDLLVLPSPFPFVAAALTAAAAAGAWLVWRESPRLAIIALTFPVLYTLYFAGQKVMIVRNLMVVAPFGAVLAGRGLYAAWSAAARTRWPRARFALPIAATAVLAAHAVYDVGALESIRKRSAARTRGEFQQWLVRQPVGSVQLSDRLQQALGTPAQPCRPDAEVAMFALDTGHAGIVANEPAVFLRVFGPREVNLNYYPDWIGDDHIVVLSNRQARRFGVIR